MKKPVQDWALEIYQTAKAHGWHDGEERGASAYACLFASELSEALEEYRAGRPMVYGDYFEEDRRVEDMAAIRALGLKPEGIAVELIDCVIRILDWAMATYGEPGPHSDPGEWEEFAWEYRDVNGRDLKEMPIEEMIAAGHWYISHAWKLAERSGQPRVCDLEDCASLILAWLEARGVDTEAVLELKHAYNKTRPYRHGGKVI